VNRKKTKKQNKIKLSIRLTIKEKTVGIAYAKIKRGKEHMGWIMI